MNASGIYNTIPWQTFLDQNAHTVDAEATVQLFQIRPLVAHLHDLHFPQIFLKNFLNANS
jgi:hypothetical protein